ncbi:AAA family ATPase [Persicobacter diffluens]|uniref:AAA-ATPase-like domain-containing protein n=1 Tax=Persicobacter diffluens TaxID=981 RepID=A0AAN5ALU8_9BACT|nr:hypothetical protein PEDI_42210 [Persicobacter diffluens]
MKRLPIGQSDFRQIRNEDAYYIDKSLFIEELMHNHAQTLLLPRPRRFGKTLNMSMLSYFFDIDHAEEYRGLFSGLAIEQSEEWQHQGKYPVIFLTFKDLKHETFADFIIKFQKMLQEYTEERFGYLLDNDHFLRSEKRYLDRIVENEADHSDLEEYLRRMPKVLKKQHGIAPILLIDEYDAPIHAAHEHGYLSEMVSFMRNFLSAGFKDKDLITKGVITGILRVAKEDIFSGLNNLATYTVLNYPFSDKFGLTQSEVDQLLEDAGCAEDRQKIAEWYNGYTFGQVEKIYNPWSILNYVSNQKEGLKAHWVNTSSDGLIKEILPKVNAKAQELLFDLTEGKSVKATIADHTIFQDLEQAEAETVLGLLLFSGYLTASHLPHSGETLEYNIRIPNSEVQTAYKRLLKRYLNASETVGQNELLTALLEQRQQTFANALSEYLKTSFSFFDIGKRRSVPEKIYHAFMLGLLAHLSREYHIRSNRESGYGRADLIIYPKDRDNPKGWVLEFKQKDADDKGTLEELAQEALAQIHEKEYLKEIHAHGHMKVMCMGIAFDGKEVACAF